MNEIRNLLTLHRPLLSFIPSFHYLRPSLNSSLPLNPPLTSSIPILIAISTCVSRSPLEHRFRFHISLPALKTTLVNSTTPSEQINPHKTSTRLSMTLHLSLREIEILILGITKCGVNREALKVSPEILEPPFPTSWLRHISAQPSHKHENL